MGHFFPFFQSVGSLCIGLCVLQLQLLVARKGLQWGLGPLLVAMGIWEPGGSVNLIQQFASVENALGDPVLGQSLTIVYKYTR